MHQPRRSASSLACNVSSSDMTPVDESPPRLPAGDGPVESPSATGCLLAKEDVVAAIPVGASVN